MAWKMPTRKERKSHVLPLSLRAKLEQDVKFERAVSLSSSKENPAMNPNQSNIHIASVNLGRWLVPELPPVVVDAARDFLSANASARRLRGWWIRDFGEDLHLHLTTYNGDFSPGENPASFAVQLALGAALAALARGLDMGLGSVAKNKTPLGLSAVEQTRALELRVLDFPFTERGAEPVFVAKALNASWGFFNRALFNLYFNPDKGSGHRIEGNDFRAVVESIADLKAGKTGVRTFQFGPAEGNELLALVTDPDEWRLSEVYAVKGRFGEGKLKDEPAALVAGSHNPVLIGRSQSGLPAVGEFTQAVGEFYFGPGGQEGGYRVGLVPATFAEAHSTSAPDGVAKVVAYAYQSYDKGRVPENSDVVDIFAQNPPETRFLHGEAMRLIRHMTTHGEFEPYLNAETAVSRAERVADQLSRRFKPVPGGADPVVTAANRRARFTVSDIKADAGGRVGHTTTPSHFGPVADASLQEAKDAGLIFGTSKFIAVGDDGHLLMTHAHGADSNTIHLLAYKTFFRQVWVAEVLGYKWYGLGQDLVGDASAGKKTEELAGLTEKFVSLLPNHLPEAEHRRFGELRQAFERWRKGEGEGRTPAPPFSGNVSGQGPGFAELPLPKAAPVGLLAMDKTGPAAFNLPVWEALRRCRTDGSLNRYLKETDARGTVLEIWDVERHRRIFLDVETESEAAQRLLGATDKFNVKRIWTRTADWNPDRAEAILGDILLAASTEKLAIITGGEYRGKDDPVLLAVEPLANGLNLFMRDRFYMTQGDGRGSHNMFPAPLAFGEAIATVNSRAVSVAAMIALDAKGEIRAIRDVFADPAYDEARDRASRLNKAIWDAHGGNFSPVGVGASKVEQSYPLAKMIARITAPGSPYELKRH
jgi:fructose 1,6-bisphosphate aldolase/phosphatase